MGEHTLAASIRESLWQVQGLHAENRVDSFRKALELVRQVLQEAKNGSHEAAWAHGYAAVCAIDFGFMQEAEQNARTFLTLYPQYPAAAPLWPWVIHALAIVYRRLGRRGKAISLLREAIPTAEGEIAERIRLTLVWTLCESGKAKAARRELPTTLHHLPLSYLEAARARLCEATGNWAELRRIIDHVMKDITESPLYDRGQFKHLCVLQQRLAEQAGDLTAAEFWARQTDAIHTLSRIDILTDAMPTWSQGGGERCEIEVSPSGPRPAGHERPGTLGTVG